MKETNVGRPRRRGPNRLSFFMRTADLGDGYGFPSSHSQWMAYFATFLICHVRFRHRFTPTGNKSVDLLLRLVAVLGLIAWAGGVAYSRWVPCPPQVVTRPTKLIICFIRLLIPQGMPWVITLPCKYCGVLGLGSPLGPCFTPWPNWSRRDGPRAFWGQLERGF